MLNRIWHQLVFALILLPGWAGCSRISATDAHPHVLAETAIVKRGEFRRVVRLTGTVGATQSFNVLAPRLSGQMMGTGMMVITKIVRNGAAVRKGDVLVEFDRQAQLKNILDRQAEYDGLAQQIRKKQADQISAKITDETEIKSAEVDVRTARVEMRKNELIPRYQAEINKANLAEAEAQLQQVKSTYDLKRQAEAADIRILEIQRDRALRALEYAKSNVEKMTIVSPMDGLAVLTPANKGSRTVDPQEGDEVRAGSGILLVVNPSAMQVSARINQVDVSTIHPGMAAEIRLDAYPDLVFSGTVDRISSMGTSSSNSKRIRNFYSTILIHGMNPKLLPDLTAAVDVQLQTLKDVLLVPRQAVMLRNGRPEVQSVANGKPEFHPVVTGPMNDCEAVIESGLKEGMRISLDPTGN